MSFVRRVAWLLAIAVLAAHGQAPLQVGYQKRVEFALSGATAAYSLDSNITEASVANGLVAVVGKAPGTTNVVIVTQAGVQTLAVTVPMPAPILPPGFEPPANRLNGETGSYEFRYNSDPGQITNSLEFRRTQGDSFDRFHMVNANLFSAGGATSNIGFPLLSYEISRPAYDYTFLDQNVANSPLTLDNYMVRGMHARIGDWQFHGGMTSIATFQGLFLATDPEYVAGVSRDFKLDGNNTVQANFYYFRNPAELTLVSANGPAGTFVYRFTDKKHTSLLTEWGFSHGAAFAARGSYDDEKTHLTGNLRMQGPSFATLAVNNQHGTFADLSANRKINSRLDVSADLNQSNFNLRNLQQNTFTTTELLNFRLTHHWSITGGSAYSSFQSKLPAGPEVRTFNVPAGIDFSSRHFGSGFQYERTVNFESSGGNDYAGNVRGSFGAFNATAYYRHDVQVPTLAAVFSQLPGLQDALERAGIVATTPEQLADLLRNTALLATLGFTTPLVVDLAPSRNDYGANLTWLARGRHKQQLDLTYLNSDTKLVVGSFRLETASASYAQRLTANNTLVGTAGTVRSSNNGVHDLRPLFSLALQHRFNNVPGLILPGRHGVIEGRVFRDDDSSGVYKDGMPSLSGIEVKLDDERVTHTDAAGYYSFHHVPYGAHQVQASVASAEPFFFTTDSPATTDINSTVNFGVSFAKGQIFGFVRNDAGAGVSGITVEIQGEKLTRRSQTSGQGKFAFPGLPAGSYTVQTVADSYPAGYSLQALAPEQLQVEAGKPADVEFKVRALRSVSGHVSIYDKDSLKTVPLAGVVIRIKELELEMKTGENGAYLFRNLPAGTFTISVEFEGRAVGQTVTVPSEPASIKDVELNVGTK